MPDDFKAALARVQSDYDFYIRCQSDPETALADYALTADQRSALSDPERLADALKYGSEKMKFRFPTITIKISGTHDWVNRAAIHDGEQFDELIAREVEAINAAQSDDERGEATLRLMQLLG
jgi:hypothetical protein